ncbi:THAP domain-containing protein 2-like [Corticium candelabrum]|uniref:THAP domain-containing protein 2-like n=1 Tax=Corticium candelabrum TaxID=121492 RepID=UPI002E26676B|nr:THAP domain-containing protein 2-like [Corticium candelabrum]
MPACCAWGCFNRYEKGHTMYRFPRDPARRKVWTNRVSRKNWTPTLYSYLCDAHFDSSQFEQHRKGGKKKLKWNAVPTIFPHRKVGFKNSRKSRNSTKEEDSLNAGVQVTTDVQDHSYAADAMQEDHLSPDEDETINEEA